MEVIEVVVLERERICPGRELDIARARALGLMDEVSGWEGVFGFEGRPVLGVELDEFDTEPEWTDTDVVEPETDGVAGA